MDLTANPMYATKERELLHKYGIQTGFTNETAGSLYQEARKLNDREFYELWVCIGLCSPEELKIPNALAFHKHAFERIVRCLTVNTDPEFGNCVYDCPVG